MSGYLFAHFIGEHKDGEQIYFSVIRFWCVIRERKNSI